MSREEELTREIARMAGEAGADMVGFADVEGLAALPRAVVVAMRHSPEVVADPEDMPNRRYAEEYRALNERLTELARRIAARLETAGYEARANQATVDTIYPETLAAPFSHKMAATRAGLGWIGRSALLVTRELGPALRMASVLTEAPLVVGEPIAESECGECVVCVEACPAGAIRGESWRAGMARGELLDAKRCHQFRTEAAQRNGVERPGCGMCLAVCPRRPS